MDMVKLPVRGVQWLFWVILLALSAYLVWGEHQLTATYDGDVDFEGYYDVYYYHVYSPQFAYMLFAAIWTFIVLIPLTLFTIGKAPGPFGHPIPMFVLEALTCIFWFSSFISVAAFVAENYFWGDLGVKVHNVGIAAAVFGAFEWVLFAVTAVLTAMGAFRGQRSQANASRGIPPVHSAPATSEPKPSEMPQQTV